MQSSDHDIKDVTNGLPKYIHRQLTQMISTENAIKIVKYIQYQKTEINLSDNYRRSVVTCLITLSRFF
jgi:hypothetical protein